MSLGLVPSIALFALSITLQPGPNNAMLMANGLNFGVRRSLPALFGLALGFAAMMLVAGFGLAAVFEVVPAMHTVLKVASVAYLLYLAWRVAAARPRTGEVGARSLSFLEGMGIICLNPQGWVFASSFVTTFLQRTELVASVLTLTVVCVTCRLVGAAAWVVFGATLRHVLKNPVAVRAFNIAMALLMVASLWPIVRDLAQP